MKKDVPEKRQNVKVLNKSGQSVTLSWARPSNRFYDGNSALKQYVIKFKSSNDSWSDIIHPANKNEIDVNQLHPNTEYEFCVIAENAIGPSDQSDIVKIKTDQEAPSGSPQNIRVEPVSKTSLRVTWKPPHQSQKNADILGYYVGYKIATSDTSYYFESVDKAIDDDNEQSLDLENLKPYTQYSVVLQAFNIVSAGPRSYEIKQYTNEGTPEKPPTDISCSADSSHSISVKWASPPLESANGIITGYKVIYAPNNLWHNDRRKNNKIIDSTDRETVLHDLKKNLNYTMQVLTMTSAGDSTPSEPFYCQTKEDGGYLFFV